MAYAVQKVRSYTLRETFGVYTSLQSLTSSGGPQYTSSNALVGWWRLNTDTSTSGDCPDSSGRGNPGTFGSSANRPNFRTAAGPSARIQVGYASFSISDYNAITIGTPAIWNALIGNAPATGPTTAATATITVTSPSDTDDGDVFVLTDTAGTEHTFEFDVDVNTVTNNIIGIAAEVASENNANCATKIANAINDATSTCADTITASTDDAEVTLTQDVGGPTGNTSITGNATSTGMGVYRDFLGGGGFRKGGSRKMSFSVWMTETNSIYTTHPSLVDLGTTKLRVSDDEEISFQTYWNDALVTWTTSTGRYPASTWTHVVLTYDASSPSNVPVVYVNGVKESVTESGTTPTGEWGGITGRLPTLGNSATLLQDLFGAMADVAIWNKALTADEVSILYNAASYDLYRVSRNFKLRGSSTSGEDIDQFSSKEDGEFALSVNPFRQGINVSEMKYVEMGLTPKIFPGTRTKIILNGVDMSAQKYFDDAVISNSSNVKLASGSRKEVPNFEMEIQNFGQAKIFNDDVPYMEMQRFDAVTYLTDDTGAMVYPYVGSNPAAKDPYQSDGVIEPLYQIRDSLSLMTIDFPFLAQGVRGSLQGEYATDSHQGGIVITQQINKVSSSLSPYEDSTEYFGPPPYSFTDSEGKLSTTLTGSIVLPGWLTDQQSSIDPWADNTAMGIYTDELTAVSAYEGVQVFILALEVMSGTDTQSMFARHHRSATAGFVYDNNIMGTDSIAFGGWKK